jgi:hypothetical protein
VTVHSITERIECTVTVIPNIEISNHRHCWLLRTSRERLRNRCAAEKRDEFAPLHVGTHAQETAS